MNSGNDLDMTILLEIPESVARAMRLLPAEQPRQLKIELALSLYAQGILSFGQARELAGMTKLEFGLLLGKRHMPRHYEHDDLQEDLAYGGGP